MTTYIANNSVPLAALPNVAGVVQNFRAAETNDGPSTYAPDGLAAAPIFGLGGEQLQGDEIVEGGIATLVSFVGPLLNSGGTCWVLLSCDGGAQQVAPAVASGQAVQLQQIGHGQCRLSVTDDTTLTLKPHNGNNVLVNGIPLQLPSEGVTITNADLSALTVFFVYLTGTTASPSLVLSTTGHVTAQSGVEVMAADTTKTLVGMIATTLRSEFVDSQMQRFCVNWFNRRSLSCISEHPFGVSFSSISPKHIEPGTDLSWLTWGDEATYATASGRVGIATAGGGQTLMQLYVDGVAAGIESLFTSPSDHIAGTYISTTTRQFPEGLHTSQLFGLSFGRTSDYSVQMNTMIRG